MAMLARPVPSTEPRPRGTRQRELDIANAITHFFRKRLGRGPEQTRVTLVDDLVIVRQHGTLSPAEQHLAQSPDGLELLSQLRRKLNAALRDDLSTVIAENAGAPVRDVFSDSLPNGTRLDVFTLEQPREAL